MLMLVLAEDALQPHDVTRLRELHGGETDKVHVCVPAQDGDSVLEHADDVVEDVARTDFSAVRDALQGEDRTPVEVEQRARRHLEQSIRDLAGAGLKASGELVPEQPAQRVVALAAELGADEIVVVTAPHWLEEVLRLDWANRIRRQLRHEHREIPVLHVIAGTDTIVS